MILYPFFSPLADPHAPLFNTYILLRLFSFKIALLILINSTAMSTLNEISLLSGLSCNNRSSIPIVSSTRKVNISLSKRGFSSTITTTLFRDASIRNIPSVVYPNTSSTYTALGLLDAYDDEYGGVIVAPECLPSSANAFASVLRASLFDWRLKGKKGVWLKILPEHADLVPFAIKEGFSYHHAEPGYVVLTNWLPDEPSTLPDGPSHQIGIGAFVINDHREVLVVKEKHCPCHCAGLWKLPTGYIDKSEDLFVGAVREVKEETCVETAFLEVIAFRHAHRLAFEKSDLLFMCMLKPLSSNIIIDEKEIQAAKWMPLEEFVAQPFFHEDHMLKKAVDICVATYENRYHGFTANQLLSKFDGQLSHLYYNDWKKL